MMMMTTMVMINVWIGKFNVLTSRRPHHKAEVEWYRPGDDDEEVESVPSVGEVGARTDESHGADLDAHLRGEVGVDGVVGGGEQVAACRGARLVGVARPVEAESHAVQ